jgi:hypothetical protein
MQTRKRAVIENDDNFVELTSFRKPRKEKHALFHNDRIAFDETFVDQRTGIQMKICLHPMFTAKEKNVLDGAKNQH